MNKIILLGGGGHCKSCIDVIEAEGNYKIIGIVDVSDKVGQKIMGYPIIGSDDDLSRLVKECKNFLITIGQLKKYQVRKDKFNYLKSIGANFPVIISPKALVSRTAFVDEGTIIMHGAVVNADSKIGKNCIANTGCLVEHESLIGDNAHLSTNVTVNGQCEVGSQVFLGSGSVLVNNIKVHSDVVIGAGSLVLQSIIEPGVYVGVPVKKIK